MSTCINVCRRMSLGGRLQTMLFITAEVETEQGGSSLDQKQGYSSNFYVTALFLTQQSSRDQSISFVHDLLAGLLQSSRTPPSSMASSSMLYVSMSPYQHGYMCPCTVYTHNRSVNPTRLIACRLRSTSREHQRWRRCQAYRMPCVLKGELARALLCNA